MHLIPQLREVERQFGRELVVIGVHAGKFHAERETENIRQAVLRLGIDHPVVNDRQFRVWRSYAVRAWPTLAFIDAAGRFVGAQAGELPAEAIAHVVQSIIQDFDSQGKIDRRPIPMRLEREKEPERPLAFPGKVLALDDGRLFVADSSHHRILAVQPDESGTRGTVKAIAGSGQAGFGDGSLEMATFCNPQGMAYVNGMLYVADTGNHAIRCVDWGEGAVTTVAGVGRQAGFAEAGGAGRRVALNSPWDVLYHDGWLYIAMAGSHQIWRLDLTSGQVVPHAGTGGEALLDGPLSRALLAQPSGLTTDGQRLYFADSEASAVRWADFQGDGFVGTIVGTGLFDFGDKDGVGDEVRLQHPLGVAWHAGKIYVADTYNNKIKMIDPTSRAAKSLEPAAKDSGAGVDIGLNEPGGLSIANGRLYVADTNNHRIGVFDLKTRRFGAVVLS
jgi:DNA-binding beta-propeller fold protein YncE